MTERPTSWTARVLLHAFFGCLAAEILFLAEHGWVQPTWATFREWVTHAFVVALFFALIHAAYSFEHIADKLAQLDHKIEELRNDERIIIARAEPLEERREIAVIGVERLNAGQIPTPLERPSSTEQWSVTISLLRFDRFQDLLFSIEYLKHFLKLLDATKNQFRILIINDKPRAGSEAAIRSFLQMSQTLGINTFVHLKSEFYEMCGHLDAIPWRSRRRTKAKRVRHVMEGQPELSLLRPFPDAETPAAVTRDEDYKLRFRDGRIFDVGPTTEEVDVGDVDAVYGLMRLAIQDNCRLGLDGMDSVLGKSCTSHWSRSKIRAVILK
jgi:hypothetical protein